MDTKELQKHLKLLKKLKVGHFECPDFKVTFLVEQPKIRTRRMVIENGDGQMPVDLRAENLNDPNHILNWSSPDAGSESVPLADDRPLS